MCIFQLLNKGWQKCVWISSRCFCCFSTTLKKENHLEIECPLPNHVRSDFTAVVLARCHISSSWIYFTSYEISFQNELWLQKGLFSLFLLKVWRHSWTTLFPCKIFISIWVRPQMTSRNFAQFLTPPPLMSYFFITKALVLLS